MILLNKLNSSYSARFFPILLAVALFVQIIMSALLSEFVSSTAYWIINMLYMLCLLACGYVYCISCRIDIASSMKLHDKPKLLDTIWLCAVVFVLVNGMTPVNDWFVSIIQGLGGNAGGIDSSYVYSNIVLALVVLCVVAPVVEEAIFRGIIGSGMLASCSELTAIVIGGLAFALFHMNMSQLLHQIITGCVLMLFLSRSGSLWVVIIGHVFNNGIVVLLDNLVYSSGWYTTNGTWVCIVGLVLASILVVGYIAYTNNRRGNNTNYIGIASTDKLLLVATFGVQLFILVVGAL